MRKNIKRLFSVLLAAVMCLCLEIPVAFAAEIEGIPDEPIVALNPVVKVVTHTDWSLTSWSQRTTFTPSSQINTWNSAVITAAGDAGNVMCVINRVTASGSLEYWDTISLDNGSDQGSVRPMLVGNTYVVYFTSSTNVSHVTIAFRT